MADVVARVRNIATETLQESEELWASEDHTPAMIVGFLEARLKTILAELGTGA